MSQFNFSMSQPPINKNNFQSNQQVVYQKVVQQKQPVIPLRTVHTMQGFDIVDICELTPSHDRHKYKVIVKYIDPRRSERPKHNGFSRKTILFGRKGDKDYIDPPYSESCKEKFLRAAAKRKNNDNPLHPNFYEYHLLFGPSKEIHQNFEILRRNLFKHKLN